MSRDLRRRFAEAIAATFTSPVYRSDRDGTGERVGNPEPSDRVGQVPRIVYTAGDGHPALRSPTCVELAAVVAAVRDEELEKAEAAIARVRELAKELKVDVEQGKANAVIPSQVLAWRSFGHAVDLILAALDEEAATLPPEASALPEEETT